jgi:3'-phosphoadenosine 5'-phosphosulfate (PAPS) 3'-phosphatase
LEETEVKQETKKMNDAWREKIEKTRLHIESLGDRDLQIAFQSALNGGKVVAESWLKANHSIKEKGFGDLVSEVDIASEREILHHIRTQCPNDKILSEETPEGQVTKGAPLLFFLEGTNF